MSWIEVLTGKIAGVQAGGRPQLAARTRWAARIAQSRRWETGRHSRYV